MQLWPRVLAWKCRANEGLGAWAPFPAWPLEPLSLKPRPNHGAAVRVERAGHAPQLQQQSWASHRSLFSCF